jgi:hypothetical protein
MHLNRFRKAYGLARKTFDACSECQMLSLDFLCVLLAYFMFFGEKMTLISSPIICIKVENTKRCEKFFQLSKYGICMGPKYLRPHGSTVMINRMPQPALLPLVPNETPHLIHFSFLNLLDDDVQASRRPFG